MPTEITMPQLGESVTEGTVSRWLKQPGEHVERFEVLLEIATDKVDSEIPSPAAGTLLQIIVPEGQTVQVGTLLALLSDGASEAAAPAIADQYDVEPGTQPPVASETPVLPAATPRPPISPVVAQLLAEHRLDSSQIVGTGMGGRVSKQDVRKFLEARDASPPQLQPAPQRAALFATPVAQRVAAEHAVDLQRIAGTGPGGRIIKDDVLRHVEQGVSPAQRPAVLEPPTPVVTAATAPVAQPQPVDPLDDAELVPLTAMRRSIAAHMVLSKHTSPHVTNVFEVDASRIVAHREQQRAEFERQGVRLTYTAYFFQATAAALRAVPALNGRYTDQGIVMNRRVHVGMAVALDEGLIVPVVRDADEQNLLGLARTVNDLATRARTRKLRPDEVQGGTFTVTNHGTGGSLFGTPVINQPQSGILGIGAMVKRPVVVTLNGQDMIAIRPMIYCSLTFDHRLVDGSTADAFLTVVKQTLEQYA